MTPPTLAIRPERDGDAAAIHAVHTSAFSTDAEARLVDELRKNAHASVSMVAVLEDGIIGHVLFSPVSIEPNSTSARGAGLAPVGVRPEHQRQGVGGELIQAGIEECRRAAFDFIVVLGEPGYYRRFGFRRALAAGLANDYGVDEEFMLLELNPRSLKGACGVVIYSSEFLMFEDQPPAPGGGTIR
jgi:putative acetyltransferase